MHDDLRWLMDQAKQLIERCKVAGAGGQTYYLPDGSRYYRMMYLRDFTYMVEGMGESIPLEDVRLSCLRFVEHTRQDGVVPEAIGSGERPVPWYVVHGPLPPTDNPQFLVKCLYQYSRRSGDPAVFRSSSPVLEKALRALPADADSGLIRVDPDTPHTTYGFTDTVAKTGEELFSSLLLAKAWGLMAEMYALLGDSAARERCQDQSAKVRAGLRRLWREDEGCFHAASGDCDQPDIWGSAYACYSGIACGEQARRISRFLASSFDRIVWRGHIRHVLAGTYWQRMIEGSDDVWKTETVARGKFQNGAYWATPAGWVAKAISLTDPSLAVSLYADLIAEFRQHGIWECINEGGYFRAQHYVVSAVNAAREVPWLSGLWPSPGARTPGTSSSSDKEGLP